MKNLELMGVREMDAVEVKEVIGRDEPGYGIAYYAYQIWDAVNNPGVAIDGYVNAWDTIVATWERR